MVELAVVILQWGKVSETLRCLDALDRSEGVGYRVVVVDNASPEGMVETLRAARPELEVVENGANLGFAEGNNRVLRRLLDERAARRAPRFALVLNNDVEVEADCLARMLDVARSERAAGVGAINLVRGGEAIGSSGGFLRWPSGRYRDAGAEALASGVEAFEVETLAGSTLLVDLDLLAGVGVFDPAYFCVYEETDLCLRLREAGGRLFLATHARARHAVGASTSRALHFYFRFRNRVRFARRHAPGVGPRFWAGYLAEVALRVAGYVAFGRIGDARGVLAGAFDGVRGVTGQGGFPIRATGG